MATKFNQCPNCGRTPSKSFLGGTHINIFACKKCDTCYCNECGDGRCPNCGSGDSRKAGEVYEG